ncbi:MFS transporter [Massilia yuzhufengensis]|uniref:MFS transporter, YNFM family, putative membrane transport protein n=1 Tax=Massilia yuzhufengensis TaxID=1164594 RepID=A0A1I1T6N1_9BURK|nr:MFS transporter [Massilia yuzhufengensis]SFD54265.1 MFS transporter, YNFM family, putative membrane transport protein [Massilia yuzhufengensis]
MNTRGPIAAGSPAFRRINRAMAFGGFSVFALLYCVQPLMPLLARDFSLTPAQSSLALSVSTATLAVALLASGFLAERIGRKQIMTASMLGGALLTLGCAFAADYTQLVGLRVLLGLVLGGLPAVAMAYLSDEIEGSSLGLSMGMYISGSAFGGMSGRVLSSVISDYSSWRVAVGVLGVAGLYAAWEFARSLPPSRHAGRESAPGPGLRAGLRTHLADAGLPWLFVLSFLLMGCFVSLYNYISYRLLGAPFGLSQSAVGTVSLLYLLGIFSAMWAGKLADRLGRRNVLWLVLGVMLAGLLVTLHDSVPAVVLGTGLATFGFFASHSVASSWVGRRARAPQALASGIYLFCYYLGSSVVGWFTGYVWEHWAWPGVVAVLGALLALAMAIALRLRSLAPISS